MLKVKNIILVILVALLFLIDCDSSRSVSKPLPTIQKKGQTKQLIVDSKPYLILGGELHNSSSSSREYMQKIWPKLQQSGMNTVLAAVSWALVEPEEGKLDFSLVDGLIKDARKHNLRLILLWFGAWKNGQSHYVPDWVKRNYEKYPRVRLQNGKPLEILSVFSNATRKADAKALAALMRHIKKMDSSHRTVIMVQVQNEVGVLGASRDFSSQANAAFNKVVPGSLLEYLSNNKESLTPSVSELWSKNGYKTSGTWEDIFGKSKNTNEVFMAWHYAKYINYLANQAKQEYNLPIFVNAWLVQPQDEKPGDYPSGGPQAHVLDIWQAGASAVDLFCPDIYVPDFKGSCEIYTHNNNPLFIPESEAGEEGVGQLFYAIGDYNALGYSPFGFEDIEDTENGPMARAYKLLSNMEPVILKAQRQGNISGVLLEKDKQNNEELEIGEYKLDVELLSSWGTDVTPERGYGIIIHSGPDEFVITGHNIEISFSTKTPAEEIVGIANLEEGKFVEGKWIPRRRLNGDAIMLDYDLTKMAQKNKTGTGLKFTGEDRNIQKVELYKYE